MLPALDAVYPSVDALYQDLHQNPELSLREKNTAAKMATRLRALGFDVTERVGGFGVVGVLRNGAGPTLLVRTDLDALPVKEQTGLPFASTVTVKDDSGVTLPVMHACGHDMHMACWVGAATLLSGARERWQGTLLFVGQPAEELLRGAVAMIKDGLFTRFPRPDFAVAMHDTSLIPAGQVGVTPGYAMANNDAVDVTVYGKGGHGAFPHLTVDPVAIAARIVVALQTVVAREMNPLNPAVITVGSIHGGTKHNIIPDEVKLQLTVRCFCTSCLKERTVSCNIIPDEVKLQLTVRSFKQEVQKQLLAAIERIAKAEAVAARAPKEPSVVVDPLQSAPALYNDPTLVNQLVAALGRGLGEANVVPAEPVMGSEDFAAYGQAAGVPSAMIWLGAAEPGAYAAAQASGAQLPAVHSALFAPDRERTLRTGVSVLTLAALELLGMSR